MEMGGNAFPRLPFRQFSCIMWQSSGIKEPHIRPAEDGCTSIENVYFGKGVEDQMDSMKKRNLFLGITCLLVVAIVAVSAVILARGPRISSVEVLKHNEDGTLSVNDLNDGDMTIPYYDIPTNSYKLDDFRAEGNGVITYEGGDSYVGINVNYKAGDIDWAKVAESGVDFAMIRVGYREMTDGNIVLDNKFKENITGATDANIPVGVYFYSKAVTNDEADKEATFVLEQIRGYNVTYPIAFFWEYDTKDDGSVDQSSRTVQCNGEQVTGFIDTFCSKVELAGFETCYYATKSMAYDKLDLSKLTNYDLWYAEYQSKPSFYYNFGMWQYTKEGNVPGISQSVPITLALKNYQK